MVFLSFAVIASAFLFYAAGRNAPDFSKSSPAFLIGLFCGVLAAAIAHLASRNHAPSTVFLKALQTIVLDGLLPLLLLYGSNLLFSRKEVEFSAAASFAGWLVPQYFGCLAVCIPLGVFERFKPADPLIWLFFSLAAVMAALLLNSILLRFWGYGGAGRLALILLFPLAALSLFAVLLAYRFFCAPQRLFAAAAFGLDIALLAASLVIGRGQAQ